MDLILWRHAEAVAKGDPRDDLARALTHKGERQAERMATWLARRLAESSRIVVSPALRCQQTAKALGRKIRTLDELGPDAAAETILQAAEWPTAVRPVLVVGHQPTLGMAAALALTGSAAPWAMRKGAVWWLRHRNHEDGGEVLLLAVQSPDCL
jgi:phosphohistidine phosphatase